MTLAEIIEQGRRGALQSPLSYKLEELDLSARNKLIWDEWSQFTSACVEGCQGNTEAGSCTGMAENAILGRTIPSCTGTSYNYTKERLLQV